MTVHDWAHALLEMTIAGSFAIVVVLLLRGPIRRMSGCRVSYALWAIVPTAILAVLLPPRVRLVLVEPLQSALAGDVAAVVEPVSGGAAVDWTGPIVALWAVGVVWAVAVMVRRQHKFVASLGPLTPRDDGLWQASSVAGLPAALGLFPKIVVPADFDSRYTDSERELIVDHERQHVRRGDLLANLAAAGVSCVFWFNPLIHHAAARFRRDQELACDEAVVHRHPASRARYAAAMLRAAVPWSRPAPLACQWPACHPLKERIIMLGSPPPTTRRWALGALTVCILSCSIAFSAWAAQEEAVRTHVVNGAQGAAANLITIEAVDQPALNSNDVPAESVAAKLADETGSHAVVENHRLRFDSGLSGEGTQAQRDDALFESLRRQTITVDYRNVPASRVARDVAQRAGLSLHGDVPNPEAPFTMTGSQVPVSEVLARLGAATNSAPIVGAGALRFVPHADAVSDRQGDAPPVVSLTITDATPEEAVAQVANAAGLRVASPALADDSANKVSMRLLNVSVTDAMALIERESGGSVVFRPDGTVEYVRKGQ